MLTPDLCSSSQGCDNGGYAAWAKEMDETIEAMYTRMTKTQYQRLHHDRPNSRTERTCGTDTYIMAHWWNGTTEEVPEFPGPLRVLTDMRRRSFA